MNRLKHILYFFIIYLLTGCVKEDYSKCPPENGNNLILKFEYFDQKQQDIFDARIDKVNVFIFNEDYVIDTHILVEKPELTRFQGTKCAIDPGKYYIVAWANILEHTSYSTTGSGEMQFKDFRLNHIRETTIDPLHYAPDKRGIDKQETIDYQIYEVEVLPNTIKEHTLSFMSAHHTINVYVKGFNLSANLNAHITGLSTHYDYHLTRNSNETKDLKQKITTISPTNNNLLCTTFYVPHFDNENSVEVGITGEQGSGLADFISLQEILRQQKIEVKDGDDHIIDILFTYEDGELIQITLPDWVERPSIPSFD